jgi:tRNA(Phe) wybutosine-synthesizing methylase Tyw3
LETTVTDLVGEKANNVVNQNHNHEAVTYLNANFQADKDHINTLKDEIEYLKKLVDRCMEK